MEGRLSRNVVIAELLPSRWRDYRDLRLHALKNDPFAFGTSLDEETSLAPEIWQERIGNALFALDSDVPIGMVGIIYLQRKKQRHIAHIVGFYVKPEYRGRGIGKRLLLEALTQIKAKDNIIKVGLSVNSSQSDAIRMYENLGFKTVGLLEKEINVEGSFCDQYEMERLL